MAVLHVKSPNGTSYNMNLDCIKSDSGSKAQNGYAYFPSGILIQWGLGYGGSNIGASCQFPIRFPSASMSCSCTTIDGWLINGGGASMMYGSTTFPDPEENNTSFLLNAARGDGVNVTIAFHWMAIGY